MIAQLVERVLTAWRIAPEDNMVRERHLPHEWAEWEGNHATCRWCGQRRDRQNAHQRCKVLV